MLWGIVCMGLDAKLGCGIFGYIGQLTMGSLSFYRADLVRGCFRIPAPRTLEGPGIFIFTCF